MRNYFLPARIALTEEQLDAFLAESGALDKMIERAQGTQPSVDWESELDAIGNDDPPALGVSVADGLKTSDRVGG